MCPTKDKWIKEMKEGMDHMKSNQVWELVDLTKGMDYIFYVVGLIYRHQYPIQDINIGKQLREY